MPLARFIDTPNIIALALFLVGWLAYSLIVDHSRLARNGLGRRMNEQRRAWMETMVRRDLRMIDTAIMAGLQQGTAFFASTCLFAIGGCFALLGSAEQIAVIAADLPFIGLLDRSLVEIKLFGLVLILAHAFFKFGWAYRLFNYCTILIGAVPMREDVGRDATAADRALERALRMNQIAARHFNTGLRAIFFAIAYLGWFLGPYALMATTTAVVLVLANRQFLSDARHAVGPEDMT